MVNMISWLNDDGANDYYYIFMTFKQLVNQSHELSWQLQYKSRKVNESILITILIIQMMNIIVIILMNLIVSRLAEP